MIIEDKVRFVVASYLNDPKKIPGMFCLLYSLLAQTYQNFEVIIHHDGPLDDPTLKQQIEKLSSKIKVLDNLERKQAWGHYHRYPTALIEPHADWVVFTNDDNYYIPLFLEKVLNKAYSEQSGMVIFDTVHSHFAYNVLNVHPDRCSIDIGSFITRMDLVRDTPWTDYIGEADGIYAAKIASKTNPVKAPGILFVHN
jgi:glycosyltransferase involved in cell wall biosynthesis